MGLTQVALIDMSKIGPLSTLMHCSYLKKSFLPKRQRYTSVNTKKWVSTIYDNRPKQLKGIFFPPLVGREFYQKPSFSFCAEIGNIAMQNL